MNQATRNYDVAAFNGNKKIMRQNKTSPYSGTPEDKGVIMNILETKYNSTSLESNESIGTKNLLYYCVFGVDYSALLELSVKSIARNCPTINFDLLIITDDLTVNILRSMEILKTFNCQFHIVQTPIDGVAASMEKLKIYDFVGISEYKTVMFLDADVICLKDISDFFQCTLSDKLEVVESPMMRREYGEKFKGLIRCCTITHSLGFFNDKVSLFIKNKNPAIFNGGHFMFKNTRRMQAHFSNVLWLVSIWPSVYFYEQSFMNQYFVFNDLVSFKILNHAIGITMTVYDMRVTNPTVDWFNMQHMGHHSMVHFAGTPTNGKNKYIFIKKYCEHNGICL